MLVKGFWPSMWSVFKLGRLIITKRFVVPTIENGEKLCIRGCFSCFVPTIENGEKRCIRVCFSFFLFFKQNQIPQILIGLGWVINHIKALTVITKPNCALDRRTILCLYVPRFQRQFFKHVKILSERSKKIKEQKKKNKLGFLVKESAYNSQNTQFGLVMSLIRTTLKNLKNVFPVMRKTSLKFLIFASEWSERAVLY